MPTSSVRASVIGLGSLLPGLCPMYFFYWPNELFDVRSLHLCPLGLDQHTARVHTEPDELKRATDGRIAFPPVLDPVSFYPWFCRCEEAWFCSGLSVREKLDQGIFGLSCH